MTSGGLAHNSPIPLYHRVFTVLRQRVVDGTYGPGSQLAPEDDLALEFGVSRATVRQAVAALVEAKMVSRHQGRGTFVLPGAQEMIGQVLTGNLADFIDEVRRVKIRDVSIEHNVVIPARVARQLQVSDQHGTIVRRTRLRDGEPFAYTVNFLSSDIGEKLTKTELASSSLMDVLEKKGHVIESARQTIRSQLADVSVSAALSVPLASAVLFVERINLASDKSPIEFVRTWYHGDLYEYTVTLERGQGDLRRQFA